MIRWRGRSADPVGRRLASAPVAYRRDVDPGDLARHCALLDPVPRPGAVRVTVTPATGPGEWHADVVARDRPHLLASVAGGLAGCGLDVVRAAVATWADGAALDALVVRAEQPPDTDEVAAAVTRELAGALRSAAVPEASVAFDDQRDPLHTRCEVRAPDRPGLLRDLAAAFASAGVDVHVARVTTVDGVAVDRFDVSDQGGRKLDAARRRRVEDAIAGGVSRRRRLVRSRS